MEVKHKFLDKYPIIGKEILIIGTFNPDVDCNEAEFFYGRNKNYFWDLLPTMFDEKSLKNDTLDKKLRFLEKYNIELTDLIYKVEINEIDKCNYSDDKLNNVLEWNIDNILKVLSKKNTKKVFFTRKSFNNKIKNIEEAIYKIKDFCSNNNIQFEFLPTPARFNNNEKIKEWKEKFNK